jgi:hypothetical protein
MRRISSNRSAAESSSSSLVTPTPKSMRSEVDAARKKRDMTSRTRAKKVSIRQSLPTAKIQDTSNLPPWSCLYGILFSSLIVFASTANLASDQPFALKITCHYDASLPSTLRQCRESICLGEGCSYHEDLMIMMRSNVGARSRFRLRKRPGRNLLNTPSIVLRGGALHDKARSLSSQPFIDIKSVSLALRLTCETNRRLHRGISIDRQSFISRRKAAAVNGGMDSLSIVPHQDYSQQQIMSASSPNTIRTVSEEELMEERRKEELTVFHSIELLERNGNDKHGNTTEKISQLKFLRWGPELQSYISTLLYAIGLDENGSSDSSYIMQTTANIKQRQPMEDELQIILSLTILYLDRSTNTPLHVDPLTGQPWCPPCPLLLPRTVHRLLLTAISFAAKSVRGDKSVSNKLLNAANSLLNEKQAISQIDMETMENWMLNALGGGTGMHAHQHDLMWQISPEEISIFLRNWGRLFYPQRLAAHDQAKMEHLEGLWRDQSHFGINHGHGNYWSDQDTSMEYRSTPEHHSQNQLTQRQYYEMF